VAQADIISCISFCSLIEVRSLFVVSNVNEPRGQYSFLGPSAKAVSFITSLQPVMHTLNGVSGERTLSIVVAVSDSLERSEASRFTWFSYGCVERGKEI
jgi:hypothetical protein